DGFEARWQREVAEILAGMKEWRLAHPKATFLEIEAALDARWLAARAGLLGDLALASRAADLGGRPVGERARCPSCGAELAALEEAEAQRLAAERPRPDEGPRVVQLSLDGAMVPLVGGEWAEAKLATVGEVVASRDAAGNPVVRTVDVSYRARLADAE